MLSSRLALRVCLIALSLLSAARAAAQPGSPGSPGSTDVRQEVATLRAEVERLRAELQELRALVAGGRGVTGRPESEADLSTGGGGRGRARRCGARCAAGAAGGPAGGAGDASHPGRRALGDQGRIGVAHADQGLRDDPHQRLWELGGAELAGFAEPGQRPARRRSRRILQRHTSTDPRGGDDHWTDAERRALQRHCVDGLLRRDTRLRNRPGHGAAAAAGRLREVRGATHRRRGRAGSHDPRPGRSDVARVVRFPGIVPLGQPVFARAPGSNRIQVRFARPGHGRNRGADRRRRARRRLPLRPAGVRRRAIPDGPAFRRVSPGWPGTARPAGTPTSGSLATTVGSGEARAL